MNIFLNLVGFFSFIFTVLMFLVFLIKFIIFLFIKKKFPKKSIISVGIGFLIFSGIFIYIQYFFTYNSINREYMQYGPEASSPNGDYKANVYYEPYGGAVGGVNVWVEITNNNDKSTKVIYYADVDNTVSINWVDEELLSISNMKSYKNNVENIVLDVNTEIYHDNGLACQSLLLKGYYEKCYEEH